MNTYIYIHVYQTPPYLVMIVITHPFRQDCAPLRLRIFGYAGRPWHVLKAPVKLVGPSRRARTTTSGLKKVAEFYGLWMLMIHK